MVGDRLTTNRDALWPSAIRGVSCAAHLPRCFAWVYQRQAVSAGRSGRQVEAKSHEWHRSCNRILPFAWPGFGPTAQACVKMW